MQIDNKQGFQMPIPLQELTAAIGATRIMSLEGPARSQIDAVEMYVTPDGDNFMVQVWCDHAGYDIFSRIPDGSEEQIKGRLEQPPIRSIEVIALAADPQGGESAVTHGDPRKPTTYGVFLVRDGSRRSRMAAPKTHKTARYVADALASAFHVRVTDQTPVWHQFDSRNEEGAAKPDFADAVAESNAA